MTSCIPTTMGRNSQFEQAVSFLESLYYRGIKLGLQNTYRMLECVGNPHQQLKFIHVGGTNGKGSVCSMLASALSHSGFKTGLYTSPHLISIRERFRINGKSISEDEFAESVFLLQKKIPHLLDRAGNRGPTFFEFITVLAMMYFKKKNVDLAIIEVGMGGRLDSTNVITPVLSIITEIDYDHTKPLGKNIRDIATEKAGIIKTGVPIVCGDRKREVREIIWSCAESRGTEAYLIGREFDTTNYCCKQKGNTFIQDNQIRWMNEEIRIVTPLLGKHQCQNASVAYSSLMILRGKRRITL